MSTKIYINVVGNTWGGMLSRGSLLTPDTPDSAYYYVADAVPYEPQYANEIRLTGFDAEDRENIENWICLNAGDFSVITDFCASLPDGRILDWQSPDNSDLYYMAMCQ